MLWIAFLFLLLWSDEVLWVYHLVSLFLGVLFCSTCDISLTCVRSAGSLQDGGVAHWESYVPLHFLLRCVSSSGTD